MAHSTIRGKILYTSKKPERMDEERGREYFTITRQADGVNVLLAHAEIDDAPNVVRDVMLAYDPTNMKPLDCSVRLTVGDKFEGSGWMHFGADHAECENINARDGRVSQRMDFPGGANAITAHPIIGDGLLMNAYDLSKGPGKQRVDNLALTSPDHRGATGPMLYKMGFALVYVGDESITVPAGTFDARHFQVVDTAGELPEEHPPYDIWTTADDDNLFLRGSVGGYMMTHYELVELER